MVSKLVLNFWKLHGFRNLFRMSEEALDYMKRYAPS